MNENGQEKRETLADIVVLMRHDAELCHDIWLNDPNNNSQSESICEILNGYADRIEAAWKREREAVEANALAVGGIVEAERHKPRNAAAWKETCAKCMDGETEPQHCEYYGEPNGCNSPTYGEHPTVGNAAAMHEALERLDALNLDVLKFPLDGDSSEIFDADKKPITLPAWGVATLLNEAKEAQVLARTALSAPARNCDKFADAESARQAWLDDAENWDEFGSPKLELHEWLLAPAAERKGEGDAI